MRSMKLSKRITIVLVTALVWIGASYAQEEHGTDTSKVERKGRAPVSKDLLKVTLPKPSEATLSNGLTVLIIENHRLPLISLQFNLSGAGPIFEPANLPGLAGITAQMLREGTKTRSSLQIAEQMDQLGASISASAPFGDPATAINASGASDKLEKWLAAWKKTDLKELLPPNPKPAVSKRVVLVDRPNSVQTTVTLGNIAIDRRDPDYVALTVANHILGGGPAARLFLNLREEKGYTYGVYSSFAAVKYPGAWRAGGDVRTEVTAGAMTEFYREFHRIRDEKVPSEELEEAKRALVASFALSLERPAELLGYEIVRKIYGFPRDYWDTYPGQIMAVTADDVQRVARKDINPENLQIVAVGDAGKIKPIMEKYGPVEVYDAQGKKIGN